MGLYVYHTFSHGIDFVCKHSMSWVSSSFFCNEWTHIKIDPSIISSSSHPRNFCYSILRKKNPFPRVSGNHNKCLKNWPIYLPSYITFSPKKMWKYSFSHFSTEHHFYWPPIKLPRRAFLVPLSIYFLYFKYFFFSMNSVLVHFTILQCAFLLQPIPPNIYPHLHPISNATTYCIQHSHNFLPSYLSRKKKPTAPPQSLSSSSSR